MTTKHADQHQHDGRMLFGDLSAHLHVHKKTLTPADLTAAAVTEAVDIATDDDGASFPANARVIAATMDVIEAFTGGTVSAFTVQLGNTADPDQLLLATSAFTATGYTDDPGVFNPFTNQAAYAPEALCTATGDDVDQLATGRAVLRLFYFKPAKPT